jgi:hypothetical protein
MKKILGAIAGLFLIVGLTQFGYATSLTYDYTGNLYAEIASECTDTDTCTCTPVLFYLPDGTAIICEICVPN